MNLFLFDAMHADKYSELLENAQYYFTVIEVSR